jgi:predicted acetyltransferase
VEVRPVGPEDLEQELDLRIRAFGPLGGYRERIVADNLALIAHGQMLGAYEGDRLLGSARYLDLRQWWHGRELRMAGVSGVKVAPEARGRGVATALMTELVSVMIELGYPISALYPSTPGMYRSLGWEFGGGFYRTEVAARALNSLLPAQSQAAGGDARLWRAGPDDVAEAIATMGLVFEASGDCGPTTFWVHDLGRDLAEDGQFAYLADDGFLSYRFDGGRRAIEVSYLVAGSAATARALWGILGSNSTVTRTVAAFVGPRDPIGWLVKDRDLEVRVEKRWMLRVLDPVAAVAGRGFPVGVQLSAPLRLTDDLLPANSGDYTLTVADGTGSLVKLADSQADRSLAGGSAAGGSATGGSRVGGPLVIGARGFAALFAGVPVGTLRVAGLASGDAAADALIGSAFACTPFMIDSF